MKFCVRPLLDMCPQFQLEGVSDISATTRSSNVQVTDMVGKLRDGTSLRTFERSFIAQAHHVFDKLPNGLKAQGLELGWMSVLLKQANGFWRLIECLTSIQQQTLSSLGGEQIYR